MHLCRTQIHAGGRGKGIFSSGFKGGVKICSTAEEVEAMTAKMLGHHLVTKQTGPEGQLVSMVLINEGIKVRRWEARCHCLRLCAVGVSVLVPCPT